MTPCVRGALGGLLVLVGAFLTLTHDLTVLQRSSWVLALASTPKVSLCCFVSPFPVMLLPV